MPELHQPIKDGEARFSESCIGRMCKAGVDGSMMGMFVGAAALAWYPDPYRYEVKNTMVPKILDMRYIVRGLRAPTLWGGLACATFSLSECMMESMRDHAHDSTWVNSAFGGAVTGVVLGGLTRRFDIMAASSLATGIAMGMIEYNGHHMAGTKYQNLLEKVQEQKTPPTPNAPGTVAGLKEVYPGYKNL